MVGELDDITNAEWNVLAEYFPAGGGAASGETSER